MPLYLIHCKPSGEPVGIWDDTGANHYVDPSWQKRGQLVFDEKGSKAAWSTWAEDHARGMPQAEMWLTEDSPDDEVTVLDQRRTRFFAMNAPKLDSDSTKR